MNESDEGVDLIEVRTLEEIPDFGTEADEAKWWSIHELSEELWREHGQWVDDKLVLVLPVNQGRPVPRQGRSASR